jgi:hypothetical protein
VEAQPAVPESRYPSGCSLESAGGERGERSDGVLVGPVTPTGRPSGWLGGWPTPSSSLAEAALDGGSGDPVVALRGLRLEHRR